MRIFDFAFVADWESRLQTLAVMAERERWSYVSIPSNSDLPVLDSYIRYTFRRIHDQGKLIETDTLACFNTGLLTEQQEEIFGVFTISENYDPNSRISGNNKKWFLSTWARAGERQLIDFIELPQLASYWTEPGELIFNPTLQVQLNLDHIVRDNLNRFPTELGGCLDQNGVPTDLGHTSDADEEADVDVSRGESVPLATRNALEGAMKHSIRLAQRSYRVAVPQFHHNKIQLLLPLYLRSSERPDLALTLERHGGWYRAATVLYPDWAYRHARLLARPNSEWLGGLRAGAVDAS